MNLRDVMGPGAADRGEDERERIRRQGRPCYVCFGEALDPEGEDDSFEALREALDRLRSWRDGGEVRS